MIMIRILEIAMSGFWQFMGVLILVSIFLQLVLAIYSRTLRCLNIKQHGWPPSHLDADGDFRAEVTEEIENE